MDFGGVRRLYTYSSATWNPRNPELTGKVTNKMKNDILNICSKIEKISGNVTPRIKAKLHFHFGVWMHKKITLDTVDSKYWKEQGWLDKKKPW